MKNFDSFAWLLLTTLPAWRQVESLCVVLKKKGIKIDSNVHFCQWTIFFKVIDQEMQHNAGEWKSQLYHEIWYLLQQTKFKEQFSGLLTLF